MGELSKIISCVDRRALVAPGLAAELPLLFKARGRVDEGVENGPAAAVVAAAAAAWLTDGRGVDEKRGVERNRGGAALPSDSCWPAFWV